MNTKWIYIGAIVVFILLLGYAVFSGKGEKGQNIPGNQSVNTNNAGNNLNEPEASEDKSGGSVNTGKSSSLSYTSAVGKYKDARIQFDIACQAVPTQATWKSGTEIMLDNRSPRDRVIKVGASIYNLKARGFKVIRLSSSTLPATMLVDCDQSQNVATILVQK